MNPIFYLGGGLGSGFSIASEYKAIILDAGENGPAK